MKGNEVKKISDIKEGGVESNFVINKNIKENKDALSRFRSNPWIISTFVLGLVLVGILIFGGVGGVSGDVVSKNVAADNLVAFVKSQSQVQGDVSVSSIDKEDSLYKVVLDYQGQTIPVYVSLDGKYLISDVIPLDNNALSPSEPVFVEVGDSPIRGDKNAPVTIVEFSDYQCPFCGKFFSETLPIIEKEYINTGKVKLVYKDFPLNIHPEALKAAEAARCVREQKDDEGYWKMHDKLFENQKELSLENYKKWAKMFGINAVKFDKCLNDGIYSKPVQKDFEYGQQLGVSGTPAFFINGRLLSGAQPFDAFKQVIEAELSSP